MSKYTPESPKTYETTLHEILDALAATGRDRDAALAACEAPPVTDLTPSCAICRLVRRSVERALCAFFAEFVNDPRARDSLRRARGFCSEHIPLLASLGDALAVAILYHDLAEQTRERWLAAASGVGRWVSGSRRKALAPCPACIAQQEAAARYIGAFAAGMEEAQVWTVYEASEGLCTVHAEQVIAAARPAAAQRLRQQELARLEALQVELQEIIRKNDYRFRGEPWGPEKDAWLRALRKLTRP